MPFRMKGMTRFRTRREAEKVLAEILQDGGHKNDYRIEEDKDGCCVITILDDDGVGIAGTLGS
jgi:hypothetical protein